MILVVEIALGIILAFVLLHVGAFGLFYAAFLVEEFEEHRKTIVFALGIIALLVWSEYAK